MPPLPAERPRLVVLAGPTGVGKTGLALDLAQRFGAEIINADAMQVYRDLDIGTAKPTPAQQALVPHHLLDLVDPDQDFDAAAYLRLARPLIAGLDRQDRPLIVVGGTGLYLRSLLRGLFAGPGRDPALRARLQEEARAQGREALHARLAEKDPETAARVHPRDLVRVIRALEVFALTGRTMSSFQAEHALAEEPYRVLFLGLTLPRPELYARIEARTAAMFEAGWVEEVAGLLAQGYSPQLKPLQSIGYKQVVALLQGRLTLAQAQAEVSRQTRRYAKRQMTWFRAQPGVLWHSPLDREALARAAAGFWGRDRSVQEGSRK